MLKVDLGQLDRKQRLTIDESIPADHAIWDAVEWSADGPLRVHLEAQRAGEDVVVRGRLSGRADLACRRCLTPVRVPFSEAVTFLYRSGLDARAAEDEDAYPLPSRATELDLTDAVREHAILAVPRFVLCAETCRGFCPRCGVNLNTGTCECEPEGMDERWAALKRLAQDR
jgi:uncharacterized protein